MFKARFKVPTLRKKALAKALAKRSAKWSHLPNARHIDRMLAHVKANPKIWKSLQSAPHGAWRPQAGAAWGEAYSRAWDVARHAAHFAGRDSAWGAVWGEDCDPALALVAFDDSAKYLEYTFEELEVWAALSEDPGAVMLLPAIVAMNTRD